MSMVNKMDIQNNKITLITSEDKENNFKDGQVISFGGVDKNLIHADLLLEYGKQTYGEDSIFKILEGCIMSNVFSYFLAEYYDNVVFLNLYDKSHSKYGLLYLPSEMSENQKKSVNNLIKKLKGYKIEINRELKFIDGFVESEKNHIKSDGIVEIFDQKKKTL